MHGERERNPCILFACVMDLFPVHSCSAENWSSQEKVLFHERSHSHFLSQSGGKIGLGERRKEIKMEKAEKVCSAMQSAFRNPDFWDLEWTMSTYKLETRTFYSYKLSPSRLNFHSRPDHLLLLLFPLMTSSFSIYGRVQGATINAQRPSTIMKTIKKLCTLSKCVQM